MREMKIYLCGKMSGLTFKEMNRWRELVKHELKQKNIALGNHIDLKTVNPVDYYNFQEHIEQSNKEVMQYDLRHVKTSDLVIANVNGLDTSIGSIIEIYEAYSKGIPVISLGEKRVYDKLHPWIKECIMRHEDSIADLISYISEFYFN